MLVARFISCGRRASTSEEVVTRESRRMISRAAVARDSKLDRLGRVCDADEPSDDQD